METILLEIWEILMYALIAIALIVAAATAIVCVYRPTAWKNVMIEPWAKAERRAAKKKERAELRARREFWQ